MTEQQANDSAQKSAQRNRRPSSTSKEQQTTQKRPQRKNPERTAESSERSPTKQQRPTKPRLSAKKAVVSALQQLQQLTTRTPESVIGIEPQESGWRVTVEVVESARIPDTADIMAEYLVDINSDGELASYKRGSRYFRGRTRDE